MRFALIDRIETLEAGKSITAVKNLSMAEEYLGDHFPGFPVMPGVLMLEAMVQASAWLMRYTEEFRFSTILLKEAKAAKFNSFVAPGQTLTVTAAVHQRQDDQWVFKASGTVQGISTVSARLTLSQFNLAEKNANLATSDEHRIGWFKDQFAQLWQPQA